MRRFAGEFQGNLCYGKQGVGKLCAASAVRGAFAGNGGLVSKQTTGDVFMQKKLLAIAVAGALAPAAAMAQSTVEIYGRANVGIDLWQAKGATTAGQSFDSRTRIYDQGSRLGFRVNENLGGGMRAFVVIESGTSLDSGNNVGQSGQSTNSSTGFWASRDSYAGIGGSWGDVRFGRQSPYYGNGIISQAGANYINQAMDNAFSFGGPLGNPSGRESNVLSYNSPTFGGFNASLSYGVGASEGAGFTGGVQKKEQVYAVTARYTGGAIRAQFDYGTRQNTSNVENNDRNGWKVGAGWAYAPGSQISAIYGEHEQKNTQTNQAQIGGVGVGTIVASGESPKVPIFVLNWEHMMGQWQLIAQYANWGKLKNVANSTDTEAQGFTLAGKYFLSKRTGVYGSWSKIDNKNRSMWDISNAGMSSATNAALSANNAGADPQIFAIGIMHNF
jgi:predicted porin